MDQARNPNWSVAPRLRTVRPAMVAVLVAVTATADPLAAQDRPPVEPGQWYRNAEFGFRIRFPAGWTVTGGDGHIRQQATHQGSTIVVLVRDLVSPALMAAARREGGAKAGLSDRQLEARLRQEIDGPKLRIEDYPDPGEGLETFANVEVLTHRLDRLGGRPALFIHARLSGSAGAAAVRGEQIGYQIVHRGVLYGVQAMAPVADFATRRASLERALRTFSIEDSTVPPPTGEPASP